MKSKLSFLFSSLAVFVLGGVIPAAQANVTYQLDCTSTPTCSSGTNYGSVLLQNMGSDVKVTVQLLSGEVFAGTGGGHESLTWNLNGDPSISSVSGLNTTNFTYHNASIAVPGFGKPSVKFDYYIDCAVCVGGHLTNPSTLSFTILNHQASDFTPTSQGYFFTTDILANGQTGSVGADGLVVPTPEPSSYGLLAAGLVAMGFVVRRNRLRAASVASQVS